MALVLFVLFTGWLLEISSRHQSCYQVTDPEYSTSQHNYKGKAEYAEVCSTDYQVFGDTVAQWLMAIFAILAAAFSWRAVVLVRRTWEENRRSANAGWAAVDVTRDIGEAQVRAYLSVTGARIVYKGDLVPHVYITIKNAGLSPALDISVFYNFTNTLSFTTEEPALLEHALAHMPIAKSIAAGEESEYGIGIVGEDYRPAQDSTSRSVPFAVEGFLEYRTVFGLKRNEIDIETGFLYTSKVNAERARTDIREHRTSSANMKPLPFFRSGWVIKAQRIILSAHNAKRKENAKA